jgi:hypothetical protein
VRTMALRDLHAVYGKVCRRIAAVGIGEVVSSPSSPWQGASLTRAESTRRKDTARFRPTCALHFAALDSARDDLY